MNGNGNHGNQFPGFFEDVGDLEQIQQENVVRGWEMQPNPPQHVNNNGGGPWMQQEGELVAENELAAVNNLANAAVANAVANGLMQHPDQPQHSYSVSSETSAFYRAEGTPITLELPLPVVSANRVSTDRTLAVSRYGTQSFESDYQIRELANRLGLHQGFGPSPSVEMLIQDLS